MTAGRPGRRTGVTTATSQASRPLVELSRVTKSFGRVVVLEDLSLSIEAGQMLAVTGASGSGKTTLLRLLHGQLRPTRGEIWVAGHPLHQRWRRGLTSLRREAGFVFQEHRLLPRLTSLENVVFGLQVNDPQIPHRLLRRRAQDLLQAIGLGARLDAYPEQLSGGERQRVAIARALAPGPRLLLADEPLASLDEDNAAAVMGLLKAAAAAGAAVIVATPHLGFPVSRVVKLPGGLPATRAASRPARRKAAG